MTSLTLTDDQVVEMVRQLSPDRKQRLLMSLAQESCSRRGQRSDMAQQRLRRLAEAQGLNWDEMSDAQRQELVDRVIHEDRACNQ